MALEIITTADGSHSLLNTTLNETYHSVHGAVQESLHVFIRAGLDHYVSLHGKHNIRILEIGFGTALNALMTLQYARAAGIFVQYCSIEASPVGPETVSLLNFPEVLQLENARTIFMKMHNSGWNVQERLFPEMTLEKRHVELQNTDLGVAQFDLVYHDAFAPSKQPELWGLPVLKKIETSVGPGGIFVTYSARGQLKRDLRSLGMRVETLPGPPGKKEMIRATKPS